MLRMIQITCSFLLFLFLCQGNNRLCTLPALLILHPCLLRIFSLPFPPSQNRHSPNFQPMSIVAKRLPISATAEYLYDMCCLNPPRRLQKWELCVLYYYHFQHNVRGIGSYRCIQAVRCSKELQSFLCDTFCFHSSNK